MAKVLYLDVFDSVNVWQESLNQNIDAQYIHIDHKSISVSNENIIQIARKDQQVKDKLVLLANNGFMVYVLRDGVSSLVHYQSIKYLWNPVKEKQYLISDKGVVYSYSPPLNSSSNSKLLILFSQVADKPHSASLGRHFMQNFPTIQKYLPPDVAVLRIADLGGVIGAYYFNTHALPENESNIQQLINQIIIQNNISTSDVVLYGVSKGGSGALYHGLIGGYKVVAVDPILSDDHYLTVYNDFHFVENIFPIEKEQKYRSIVSNYTQEYIEDISIICSERSAQFQYITSILNPIQHRISIFNSYNKNIKLHPDVGPNTVHLTVMLINMLLYGWSPPIGYKRLL